MITVSDVLIIAHLTLLIGLLCVTSLLLLVTLTNRLRLRKALLAWRSGPLHGIPIGPALFILLLIAGAVYTEMLNRPVETPLLIGYLATGVFWFSATWLGKTTIVTEYGIVAHLNCSANTVAWGQIVDYFECGSKSQRSYAFLYTDRAGARRRLNVAVPEAHQKRFQQIVYAKLDVRFEFASEQVYGKTTLEK